MQPAQPYATRAPVAPKKAKQKKASPAEVLSARDRYARNNRDAARIILANPQRYAGLPLEWATEWKAKYGI